MLNTDMRFVILSGLMPFPSRPDPLNEDGDDDDDVVDHNRKI